MVDSKSSKGRIDWKLVVRFIPLVIVCVLGCVAFFGAGPIDIGPEARGAEKAAAAYQAEGLPWVANDLAPRPPVRPDENAAEFILAAAKSPESKPFDKDYPTMLKLADGDQWAKVDDSLKKYQSLLDFGVSAATRLRVDFGRDYDYGAYLQFPEFASTKRLVRALTMRAQIEAQRGNANACVADLTSAFRVADLLRDDSTTIGLLVHIADQAISLDGVRRSASFLKDDPAVLARLNSLVVQFNHSPDFKNALRGEMYMGLASLRNMDEHGHNQAQSDTRSSEGTDSDERPINPAKLIRTGLPTSFFIRAFAARDLEVWTEASRKMNLHRHDPDAMAKDTQVIADRMAKHPKVSEILLSALFPVYLEMGSAIKRVAAAGNVTQALIASLEYRGRTGALPSRLKDLPGDWIDPFTGTSLRVKNVAGSFRIYSVGRNRKDDGGLDKDETVGKKSDDVVAAFPPLRRKIPAPKRQVPRPENAVR